MARSMIAYLLFFGLFLPAQDQSKTYEMNFSNIIVQEDQCREWDMPEIHNLNVDMDVLKDFEGSGLTPYVPSDRSGPTIGHGLDLGNAGSKVVRAVAGHDLSKETLNVLLSAEGLRGNDAILWVRRNPIKISKCQQYKMAVRQYREYLEMIERVVPTIDQAPREVRTATLSFVMHTGRVDAVQPFLQSRDWVSLADKIESYHDSWSGPESLSFQRRRQIEADLVRLVFQQRDRHVLFD